ncbi:hypothetical protein [Rheinheimera baltica]|uniref:hypothetical protein n=1 Tax=Rheinheimera baltica TaxID=67576 RepID=UPI00273D8D0B|nr:hypothetical protein [Rheinheimera baltica]MDP5151928.1 hypothetical protein [Rheinheimera baltica]
MYYTDTNCLLANAFNPMLVLPRVIPNKHPTDTASTSDKVKQAYKDCSASTSSMNHTMQEVDNLAQDVAKSADSAKQLAVEAEKSEI